MAIRADPCATNGRAIGDTLQLTVTVTGHGQTLGSLTLTLGVASRLVTCL